MKNFYQGYEYTYFKGSNCYIRPIRSFSDLQTVGIVTSQVSALSQFTAVCGGSIVAQGGEPVVSRGVCWSTNPNPTVSLSTKTIDGSGIGIFTTSITGLNPGTTYHVRAYATTSAGTVYGNDITFTTLSLSIGDSYGGGKVAYILQPGDSNYVAGEQHGLIAAPYNQGMATWGCYSILIGNTSTALGTGQSNTTAIINGCSEIGIAARLCDELVLNGFSDWFLPSRDELNKLYLNQFIIGNFPINQLYQCSSEYDSLSSWLQYFSTGIQINNSLKTNVANGGVAQYVRAVRNF